MNINYLNKMVLIVDDDIFILKIAATLMQNMGFTDIRTAENGYDALQIIKSSEKPIGLILTDLNMPEMDGLELLRRFAEQQYKGDILLFSGEDEQTLKMAESLARARNLRVIGSIAKPVQPDKLKQLLSQVSLQRNPQQTSQPTKSITPELLKNAIEAGQIIPWFQPKIDIKTRMPVGVEALARWPESQQGPVYPDEFIPAAEQFGLIDELTDSLLEQAAAFNQLWRQQQIDLKIAVNLSMNSLNNPQFPERFNSIVENAGSDASHFQFEVTESRLMKDLAQPLEVLLRLRMKKITLSIDDFGTGHSNLHQLRELPFDELKLDRSYIVAGSRDKRANAILESSMELARKLNMTTVAEGIETLEDWQRLEHMQCDQIQGYFAARPMPGEAIIDWIKSWPELCNRLFSTN